MIIRKQGKSKELNSPPTKIIQPRENQELVVCLLREKKKIEKLSPTVCQAICRLYLTEQIL